MNTFFEPNTWRIALTLVCFALFIAITLWAYSKSSKKNFDDIAQHIVDDCDHDCDHTTPKETTR